MSETMKWALGILGGVGLAGAAMSMGGTLGTSQQAAAENGSYAPAVSNQALLADLAIIDKQIAAVTADMKALKNDPTLQEVIDAAARMGTLAGKKGNAMQGLSDKLAQRVAGTAKLQSLINQINRDLQDVAAQVAQAPGTATKSMKQGVAQLEKAQWDIQDARAQMGTIFTSLNIR